MSQQQKDINNDIFIVPFLMNSKTGSPSLFSAAMTGGSSTGIAQSMEASSAEDASSGLDINHAAFESKNKSRKNFGLAPLTPEEFVQIETTVKQMDAAEKVKNQQIQQAKAAAAAQVEQERQRKSNNVFNKLFGSILEDTCEDNFDCKRPEVCCDFLVKKMCCASGSPVLGQQLQYAPIPVQQGTEDFPQNRPPPRY